MLKLKQRIYEDNKTNTKYGCVDAVIDDGKYTYTCHFDEKTRPRFNQYARSLGFKAGKIADGENVPDKTIVI